MTKHAPDPKPLSATKIALELGYRRVIYAALKHGSVQAGSAWYGLTPMEFAWLCGTTPVDPYVK